MNERLEKNGGLQSQETPGVPGKTLSPATFNRFQLYLFLSGAGLVGLAWAPAGLDFTMGVLLGFIVVLFNVFWTKNLVKTIILTGKSKKLFTFFYIFKFGLTTGVLVVAMVRFEMDPFGVLAGLSALMLATVFFAIDWTWFQG
jgi:hypothetical protein